MSVTAFSLWTWCLGIHQASRDPLRRKFMMRFADAFKVRRPSKRRSVWLEGRIRREERYFIYNERWPTANWSPSVFRPWSEEWPWVSTKLRRRTARRSKWQIHRMEKEAYYGK